MRVKIIEMEIRCSRDVRREKNIVFIKLKQKKCSEQFKDNFSKDIQTGS